MPESNEEVDPNFLMVQQIQATNRATYAIRGLLKAVMYEGATLLLGGLIAAFSAFQASEFGLVFAALLILVGTVVSLVAGFEALSESKVPQGKIPGIRVPKGFDRS